VVSGPLPGFRNGTLGDWGVHWFGSILWWADEKYPSMCIQPAAVHQGKAVLNEPEQNQRRTRPSKLRPTNSKFSRRTGSIRKFGGETPREIVVGCLLSHGTPRARSTWMARTDGRSTQPTPRKPQNHQNPSAQRTRWSRAVDLLWADFIEDIESWRSKPTCDCRRSVTTAKTKH